MIRIEVFSQGMTQAILEETFDSVQEVIKEFEGHPEVTWTATEFKTAPRHEQRVDESDRVKLTKFYAIPDYQVGDLIHCGQLGTYQVDRFRNSRIGPLPVQGRKKIIPLPVLQDMLRSESSTAISYWLQVGWTWIKTQRNALGFHHATEGHRRIHRKWGRAKFLQGDHPAAGKPNPNFLKAIQSRGEGRQKMDPKKRARPKPFRRPLKHSAAKNIHSIKVALVPEVWDRLKAHENLSETIRTALHRFFEQPELQPFPEKASTYVDLCVDIDLKLKWNQYPRHRRKWVANSALNRFLSES